jgi:hypothetical protein
MTPVRNRAATRSRSTIRGVKAAATHRRPARKPGHAKRLDRKLGHRPVRELAGCAPTRARRAAGLTRYAEIAARVRSFAQPVSALSG